MISQCQAIGEKTPRTWDDYRKACLLTFGGGYCDSVNAAAFRHGMETIFNLLNGEFPQPFEIRAAVKMEAQPDATNKPSI